MPNFYSMINARFNERRTYANRGDILSSYDKNQIHVHNHTRVRTVSYVSVIIEPFWSFCVINMPKRLFFESLDPSMMKPYRLVFITNVVSDCSGEPVLLCNLVGSLKVLGWMKNLDTYVLPLISCRASISFLSFTKTRTQ